MLANSKDSSKRRLSVWAQLVETEGGNVLRQDGMCQMVVGANPISGIPDKVLLLKSVLL